MRFNLKARRLPLRKGRRKPSLRRAVRAVRGELRRLRLAIRRKLPTGLAR